MMGCVMGKAEQSCMVWGGRDNVCAVGEGVVVVWAETEAVGDVGSRGGVARGRV